MTKARNLVMGVLQLDSAAQADLFDKLENLDVERDNLLEVLGIDDWEQNVKNSLRDAFLEKMDDKLEPARAEALAALNSLNLE